MEFLFVGLTTLVWRSYDLTSREVSRRIETLKESTPMPTTFARESAFETLYNEQLGFRLADPLRVSEKSLTVVVPILRISAPHRQYVTLPEAGTSVDIHDTGSINRFSVKNHTEENLFIR